MVLAKVREITTGYYGTGTAFEDGSRILEDSRNTALALFRLWLERTVVAVVVAKDEQNMNKTQQNQQVTLDPKNNPNLCGLLQRTNPEVFAAVAAAKKEVSKGADPLTPLIDAALNSPVPKYLQQVLQLYTSVEFAIEDIAWLVGELLRTNDSCLNVVRLMYNSYAPFRYCIENKEAALLIRNKAIVDNYVQEATPEERSVLEETEAEAQLTKKWVLLINEQDTLQMKTLRQNFHSPELTLLHKIQCLFLQEYRRLHAIPTDKKTPADKLKLTNLSYQIQMTILAVSEALGFAG